MLCLISRGRHNNLPKDNVLGKKYHLKYLHPLKIFREVPQHQSQDQRMPFWHADVNKLSYPLYLSTNYRSIFYFTYLYFLHSLLYLIFLSMFSLTREARSKCFFFIQAIVKCWKKSILLLWRGRNINLAMKMLDTTRIFF